MERVTNGLVYSKEERSPWSPSSLCLWRLHGRVGQIKEIARPLPWQTEMYTVHCTLYTVHCKCTLYTVQSVQRQFGVGRNCDLPPTATGHRQIYCPFQYIIISGDQSQKKQTKVIIRDIILGRPWLSSRRLDGNVSCRQHNCFASTPFTLSSFSLCS